MIKRYSRKELTDIWSEENKYKIWLNIKIAAAEAMEKYKIIPKGVASIVKKKSKIKVERIHVIESKVKHDVIAFLTSTAGFMFLRLRRGSFSGRLIVLGIFGMVVYSFVNAALIISTDVLKGDSYEFSVSQILTDLGYPLIWLVVLWMATTIKSTLQAKQAQSDRYWGI